MKSGITMLLGLFACALLPACDSSTAPGTGGATLNAADSTTMQIYNRSCISCHAAGSGGAPRTGDQAAWQPRIAKGMEVLIAHTMEGFNGMPPKGMCMDCTAEQMEPLIRYMAQQ